MRIARSTIRCQFSVVLAVAAFAQTNDSPPKFEIADVHAVAGRNIRGPFVGGGRYEIRTASMLDLVRTAYTVDPDKIYGGPSWLELDRFDIVAKLPPGSNAESRKTMLQGLLADRFGLAVHNDTKPMPAYALVAGKHAGLKEADPAVEPGCKTSQNLGPREVAVGSDGPIPMMPMFQFICHNLTMPVFAERLRTMIGAAQYLNNKRVVDQTELKGAWDFTFQYSLPLRGPAIQQTELTTLFDAVEKQLGLKLELVSAPMPVLVVDSASRTPTPNPPDLERVLPAPPTEFDVAELKPSQPSANNNPMLAGIFMLNGMPAAMRDGRLVPPIQNGRVDIPGYTLKQLLILAWDLTVDTIGEVPKFTDTDRYDLIAKMPGGAYEGGADMDTIRPMLRALLIEKFKITFHKEEKPANAYTLTAAKPKLKPADPASRAKCANGPGPDGKDPRNANPALSMLYTCSNITMAQFAALLPNVAIGYVNVPAVDATGLEGAFDFQINFSPSGSLNGGRGGRVDANGAASASDPSGGLSFFDAITKQLGLKVEQQKRPAPVVIFDHIEPKPVDN